MARLRSRLFLVSSWTLRRFFTAKGPSTTVSVDDSSSTRNPSRDSNASRLGPLQSPEPARSVRIDNGRSARHSGIRSGPGRGSWGPLGPLLLGSCRTTCCWIGRRPDACSGELPRWPTPTWCSTTPTGSTVRPWSRPRSKPAFPNAEVRWAVAVERLGPAPARRMTDGLLGSATVAVDEELVGSAGDTMVRLDSVARRRSPPAA